MTPEDKEDLGSIARKALAEQDRAKGGGAGCALLLFGVPLVLGLYYIQPEGSPLAPIFFWGAILAAVVGLLAVASSFSQQGAKDSIKHEAHVRQCPECAETIKAEAKKCRYCNSEVTPVAL